MMINKINLKTNLKLTLSKKNNKIKLSKKMKILLLLYKFGRHLIILNLFK
jgi:hypothetical protein